MVEVSKETINDKQALIMVTIFIMGSTLIMGVGGVAKQDMWLAIIAAIASAIPVVLMYARILSTYPGKDLYDILQIVFGKVVGKIVCILYAWFAFHLGALVLRNYGEFIKTAALPETPMLVSMLFLGGLALWAVKAGIEVIGRWSEFFIFILIGFILIIGFLSIPLMKPQNLLPVLYEGVVPVLHGTLAALSFPFAETVVFTLVFSSLQTRESPNKVLVYGILLGGLIVVYAALRNVMVLGANYISMLYFPSYHAVSRINVGNFLQRLEISVVVVFTIAGFVKISVCLLAACTGIAKVFSLENHRQIATPIALLMVTLAYIVYKNIMEMMEWAFKYWSSYALPFQVFLPAIILLAVEIKSRRQKTSGKPPAKQ